MAVLRSRCAHYILQFCSWGFYLFLSFSVAYPQRSEIGCQAYFHTWCGLSANLECMSEMCCTHLAENTGHKNYAKNRHQCTIAQICCKACIDNRNKNLLNINISSTCPHSMMNFCPPKAEIGSGVWGTPANFNGCRVFASVLHRHGSTEVNHTSHDVWPSRGLLNYVYIFGAVAPYWNSARCNIHIVSKFCVLLYWHRYCTTLEQCASAKLCGAFDKEGNYGTFAPRLRHLYSAGRPSRWAFAHILV